MVQQAAVVLLLGEQVVARSRKINVAFAPMTKLCQSQRCVTFGRGAGLYLPQLT